MSGRARPVNIKEVAQEAGVSVATVSRVLNGKGPIREETRARIQEVADRLHYVPHGGARSLITNRTQTIGVLLPDIYGAFFSEVIRGIDQTASRNGFHLLVSSSHADRGEVQSLLRAMRGRVDGLILMSPDADPQTLRSSFPETLPIVLLNCPFEGSAFDTLDIDNHGGAVAMVRHLAGLGHLTIAHLAGPAGNYDARERRRGYLDALRSLGLEAGERFALEGDFSEESGYLAGRQLLASSERPTAVFAANDAMAIGFLFALREGGLDVPRDIALAGFDDVPIARFVSPPLTSVRVRIAALGEKAMERLLLAVASENGHERRQETVAVELVVRGSCGAIPEPLSASSAAPVPV